MILLLAACTLNHRGTDSFWFRNEGADMPVWVRGNWDSDTMIVHLHGGPGGPGLLQDWMYPEATEALEERYLMVWWDQRSSGIAQGNASGASLTMEQFVDDTDLLVDLLVEEYAPERLVLLGHSWGGALGTAYLLDTTRQSRFDAWIEVDGAHDSKTGFALSRQWVMEHADAAIARGEDVELWNEALAFYESTPVIGMEHLDPHGRYLLASGAYAREPENVDMIGSALFGPMSTAYFSNVSHIRDHLDYTAIDLTEQMHTITLPSLVLWGRHDGVLPVTLAEQTIEDLGAEHEVLHIFERSGHSPQTEEPEAFVSAIESFLNDVP